jgi:hypothetical protein
MYFIRIGQLPVKIENNFCGGHPAQSQNPTTNRMCN